MTDRRKEFGYSEKQGTGIAEYFSPSRIELMREINRHPLLCAMMKDAGVEVHKKDSWPEVLAEVGAFLGVHLDDNFSQLEVVKLEEYFIKELKDKRAIHVS